MLLIDNIQEYYNAKIFDLHLLKTQLSMLYEFCKSRGIPLEQIYDDYKNRENSDDWKLEVRIHETESEELIRKYYSTTKIYLFELTVHECRKDYISLFHSVAQFARKKCIKKTLDYGGGVGGLTVYLNRHGVSCDYADVPGTTWEYAGYQFEKCGLKIPQLSEKSLADMSSCYDLIVSLDCLEHLQSLSKYIKLFSFLLRDNGFLLVKSSFYGNGLHLSSNHKYNHLETFNGLMKANGFLFKGQLITRLRKNFLIPDSILRLLNIQAASGRKLIYTKSNVPG